MVQLAPPQNAIERLPGEWRERVGQLGHPAYRGDQIFQWIHRKGVLDPQRMTNLPKALKAQLRSENWRATHRNRMRRRHPTARESSWFASPISRDVETVLIPQLKTDRPGLQCVGLVVRSRRRIGAE